MLASLIVSEKTQFTLRGVAYGHLMNPQVSATEMSFCFWQRHVVPQAAYCSCAVRHNSRCTV